MNKKWTSIAVLVTALAGMFLALGSNAAAATVELRVVERQGAMRRGEPVTFAVPLPQGELRSAEHVRLLRDGNEVPAQFRATGLWRPDESIRWLLVDFQTDIAANSEQTYTLEYGEGIWAKAKPKAVVRIEESDQSYRVDTGAALFRMNRKAFDLFSEVRLADGTIVVPRAEAAQSRHGAMVRGLKPMVTRAIPGRTNKGRSHLVFVRCSPQAGEQDYTLRFTSAREYELSGAKSGAAGRGAYLKDFDATDGMVSIPGAAWLPYAWPAEGDIYTFRTIPAGYSAASETVVDSKVLERGPLRTVIRVKGSLGAAGAGVLEYTAWYHFYAGSGRVKLAFTLENNNHGGRTPDGNARNAEIGGVNCVSFDEMTLRLPLRLDRDGQVHVGGSAQSVTSQ